MPKTPLVTLACAAALVVLAFATNPSPERHREKIKAAIAERSPLASVLGLGALTAFTSTYHPLGVASYTTVNERTVSIGAFGMVFVRQPSSDKDK
jgi:multisubunit Na+/H+ antiporter MnhB subunit